jgi:hypothetical protein
MLIPPQAVTPFDERLLPVHPHQLSAHVGYFTSGLLVFLTPKNTRIPTSRAHTSDIIVSPQPESHPP